MYNELADKAYSLHTNKQYAEAEKIYSKLLKIKPEDVNILNLYGLLCIAKSNYKMAINLLTKAMVLKKSAYIATNLAKAYYLNGEIDRAIKMYNQALLYEKNDDIYFSLGLAYKKLNKYDEVIKNYHMALNINPDNYKAMYNLALAYKEVKDIDNAVMYGELCIKIKDEADIHTLLAGCCEDRGLYEIAAQEMEKAIKLKPDNHLFYYNCAVLYSKINNNEKAKENYLKAIILNKNHIDSYLNLSYIYKETDKLSAVECLKKALEINPKAINVNLALAQLYRDMYDNKKSIELLENMLAFCDEEPEIYSLLSTNYMDTGEYDKALETINKALEFIPESLNYLHGKAIALKYMGHTDEAKSILEEIVRKDLNQTQSVVTLGMMYLQNKEFDKGWKLYSQRSNDTKFKNIFKDKVWKKGTDIKNKRLLLFSDCGLGDTIMYARYFKQLSNEVKTLQIQTDKVLLSMLKDNFNDYNIIPKSQLPDEYDVVMPLMDIQYALNSNFDSIPYSEGYLKANIVLASNISDLDIMQTDKKKVGIFYRGNRKIFKNREIKFELLKDILSLENCAFYSFQMDEVVENHPNMFNIKEHMKFYADTAAIIENMDVMVTIDSSIVHMSGAMGKKTFLLLPETAEWRWFNDDKTTPWYKSVTILKQNKASDWSKPLERLKKELIKL